MKKAPFIIIVVIFYCLGWGMHAQNGGNYLYQKNSTNYNRNPVETMSIYSTDSTLVVTSKVLLNQKADHYVMTIGVNQLGKTVVEANQKLNSSIKRVLSKLNTQGIKNEDINVDFISETKVYDHKITDRTITEYFDGFNMRKNIIIKLDKLSKIDRIIDFCSEEGIHDIVKVDYVSKDLETINEQLLSEALKIVQRKKQVFEKNSSVSLSSNYRLASERFKIYYPKNLYKQYDEAYESSLVNTNYNSNYTKTEMRKEKSFYYDGIETDLGVDKIIDKVSPAVGIQYVMEIQVVYELKG